MVKLTVRDPASAETPSEAIVKGANGTVTVEDAKGRSITVKKIAPLDRMRLFKAVGPLNSQNQQYLGYAILAASVTAVDGDPRPFPTNELQVEATVQMLGDEGMEAVGQAHVEHFGIAADADVAEQAKN